MTGSGGRIAARAAAMLSRPGAWLEPTAGGYAVRTSPDRRRRAALMLDEAGFLALVREPGLKPRLGGGWSALASAPVAPAAPVGRPGVIDGQRAVMQDSGRMVSHRANLGESPIAWLARRRDGEGRPWLTPAQAAAGEKLREDFHLAGVRGRLTMAWDGAPKGAGGRFDLDPSERALAAKRRVAAALSAVGPELREMLEKVCLAGSALEAAERALGIPRRSGKTVLRLALQKLAQHYGVA